MSEAVAGPVVITLPTEIDATNSEQICAQICSALDDRAADNGVQLRLAVSADGPVLRALGLMGFDHVLQIFPSLREALAAS